MVQPVTWPSHDYLFDNQIDGLGSIYDRRTKSRQPPPYTEPAKYYRFCIETTMAKRIPWDRSFGGMATAGATKSNYVIGPSSPWYQSPYKEAWADARSLAYQKLASQVRKDAMLAVNLIQRQQAIDMLVTRLKQVGRVFTSLRRGNVAGVITALNIKGRDWASKRQRVKDIVAKRRPKSKSGFVRRGADVSDVFLEIHFGWAPLVEDIHNSIDILQQPLPDVVVNTRARKVRFTVNYRYDISPVEFVSTEAEGFAQCGVSTHVYVSNPNLWLANQLGLINPAAVLWELVPFSFVVDWFSTVGDFIGSWTDFVGLTFHHTSCSTVMKVPKCTYTVDYNPGPAVLRTLTQCNLHGYWFIRDLDLPSVELGLLPARQLSLVRGVTAISLLMQQLRKQQNKR